MVPGRTDSATTTYHGTKFREPIHVLPFRAARHDGYVLVIPKLPNSGTSGETALCSTYTVAIHPHSVFRSAMPLSSPPASSSYSDKNKCAVTQDATRLQCLLLTIREERGTCPNCNAYDIFPVTASVQLVCNVILLCVITRCAPHSLESDKTRVLEQ